VGVGVIVGLAVGIGKGVEEQRRYRAAVEGCVAARLAPAETGVHDSARLTGDRPGR